MKNKSVLKNPWIYILVIVVIVIFIIVYGVYNWKTSPGEYDSFAKCLTEKGVKMYGTNWCGYCKKQKEMFGKSFEHINFINCDYEKDRCSSAGVSGYPTWKINKENYPGTQSFNRLSELTGCGLK